jgi:hypothetical protein
MRAVRTKAHEVLHKDLIVGLSARVVAGDLDAQTTELAVRETTIALMRPGCRSPSGRACSDSRRCSIETVVRSPTRHRGRNP